MTKRNTTFLISGGAGRVITAEPALSKYARLNPDDDFKVLVYGWENLFWSHPILQQRTFGVGQKGIYDAYVKNNNIISPEPYQRWSYYNQISSLAEAFDEEINNTDDHSDLTKPHLYLHSKEINTIKKQYKDIREKTGKEKFIVFQPYGSGLGIVDNRPFDSSRRSIDVDDYLYIVKELSKDYNVVFFGDPPYTHPGDSYSINFHNNNPDLRMYMTLIHESDYFIGCDSVGQHMARAFDKPGLIIMGSTFEKNVSYQDHFKIFRNEVKPVYNPIRITGVDCEFADRMNDMTMTFTDDELDQLIETVKLDIYDPSL